MNRLICSIRRAALFGAALSFAGSLGAQDQARPAAALNVTALAGQPVPVLPITYITAEGVVGVPVDRLVAMAWADSLVGDMLEARGPEVQWMMPAVLRSTARRAPSLMPAPEKFGQATLRAPKLDRVPDPLRVYMRSLAALTNSRLVMVPAAIRFTSVEGGVNAEIDFVLADARNGSIMWRSRPNATAATPAEAVQAATALILPDLR